MDKIFINFSIEKFINKRLVSQFLFFFFVLCFLWKLNYQLQKKKENYNWLHYRDIYICEMVADCWYFVQNLYNEWKFAYIVVRYCRRCQPYYCSIFGVVKEMKKTDWQFFFLFLIFYCFLSVKNVRCLFFKYFIVSIIGINLLRARI